MPTPEASPSHPDTPVSVAWALDPGSRRLRKVVFAIVLGLLGFLLDRPISILEAPVRVSFIFGMLLPLLVGLGWGGRYALIAATVGLGAQACWWNWPANGWANVVVAHLYVLWVVWQGWAARRRATGREPWLYDPYIVQMLFAVVFAAVMLSVFRWAFLLNPAPWAPESLASIPFQVVLLIIIKNTINFFLLVLLADVLLHFGWIRRCFGLPRLVGGGLNAVVLGSALAVAFSFWLLDAAAQRQLVPGGAASWWQELVHPPSDQLISRLILVILCLAGGVMVARLMRRRVQMAEALQSSEERMRITLASIGDAVIATDRECRVTMLNTVAAELTGWQPAAAIGAPLTEVFRIISAETRRPADDPARLALATGRIVGLANHTILISRDGTERQIADSAAPITDAQSGVIGVVLVFRDVTREYALQEQVRRNAEDLRVTLASIGDAVIATDAEGRITRMNPVAERLTGWPVAEAAGQPLLQVFRIVNAFSRAAVEDPAAKVLASGEIVGLANHTVLIARDGTEYQIADSGAPIRSASGVILGVVLVFRDVTAEYALQEQVRQSQKMDAIGQLAGGIAHDFNNMLGGILGAAELLGRRLDADDRSARYLTMIQESADRAAGLTANLLAFARRQPLVPVPIDVHHAVQAAVGILRSTIDRRVVIETELTPGTATILGDLGQMESVFLNLGINAAHAMPEGGQLSFRSQRIGSDQIEITVADTGSGIAPEHLPRIFEPFFTTKGPGKGTGLGLSASLGTVQQGGGTLAVTSTVGLGSTFRVVLPLAESHPVSQTAATAVKRGSGLILVVDDEAILRKVSRDMLESCGYHVLEAENGSAAVDLVRTLGADIDLVLLDMIMPVMSGRDCFARLQQFKPGIRVLLASGYSQVDDLLELRQRGLAGVLAKPFHMAELSQAVAAALQAKLANASGDSAAKGEGP